MRIGNICSRGVIAVTGDESVRKGAELMREHHVGDVVIVADGNAPRVPIGLVTDRDLVLEVLSKGLDADAMTLAEVMSEPIFCLEEDEGIDHGVLRMRAAGVRRAPVVDRAGRLIGMLSMDDVIGVLSERLGDLSALLGHERRRERELRPGAMEPATETPVANGAGAKE